MKRPIRRSGRAGRAGRRGYRKPSRRRNTAPTLEAKAKSLQSTWRMATDRQGSLTIAEARAILGQDHVCPYCRQPIQPIDLSWDHIQPRSRGGSSEPDNLVLCHRECNQVKGALTAEEFQALLAVLDQWPLMRQDVWKRLRAGGVIFRRRRR